MNKNKYFYLIIFVCSSLLFAEEGLRIESKIDTNNLLIGDQFRLKISATFDNSVKFQFPKLENQIGKLEIININKIDTIKDKKYTTYLQTYTITAFDTGNHVIPGLNLVYERKGFTTPYIAQTDSITIRYSTLAIDTAQAIKDIKPPIEPDFNWLDYWYFFLFGILFIIIIIAGYFYYKKIKNKPAKEQIQIDPKIPPYVLALEALKKIENEKLWQNGKIKKYYIEITIAIRTYLERTTPIKALELTSDEIYESLKKFGYPGELIENLKFIFNLADLAKFAKEQPLANENIRAMELALLFIKEANEIDMKKRGEVIQRGNS